PIVKIEPLGLPDHPVRHQPQPGQVLMNCGIELQRRALAVGVVNPEDERAAILPSEQEVVQRGTDIADMQPARRRWRKAGDYAHRDVFTRGPVWKKLLIG